MACPRPRRIEHAGRMDVLDIILAKDATSPPYFCGSPPRRSTNPLVLDARFGEEAAPPHSTVATAPPPSPGGCGPHPAAVRIEGFDCLGSDRRRSSRGIAAVA